MKKKPSPKSSFREKIQFYLIDCRTLPGKLIDMAIILLNIFILAIFVLETYNISESARNFLIYFEVVVVAFFVVEYFARLYGAKNRVKHLYNIYSLIDLIAIIPTVSLFFPAVNIRFMRIIRIVRIFRIFRFLRFTADPYFFFGSVRMSLLKVLRLVLTIFMIFFISSGLIWQVESTVNPAINNFGDAFYFTVVTLTTVGFGDIAPVSDSGRLVTVLMILSGIILIPWQASQIIKEWIHISNKKRVVCKKCGLMYHDKDASHCKSCGNLIYQEYEGN